MIKVIPQKIAGFCTHLNFNQLAYFADQAIQNHNGKEASVMVAA